MKNWSLFLDRDGVINSIDDGFVNSVEDIQYIPGVLEALAALNYRFEHIVVVTNQAGVGYGYMKQETLEAIHARMDDDIRQAGGRIDAFYYCPSRVSEAAPCRKPNTGMAHWAQRDYPAIDFEHSWMVGDRDTDIIFGQRLGMKTAWIGDLLLDEIGREVKADYYASDLLAFAHFIEMNQND